MSPRALVQVLLAVASLAAGCAFGMAYAQRRVPREVSCTALNCSARCP